MQFLFGELHKTWVKDNLNPIIWIILEVFLFAYLIISLIFITLSIVFACFS